MVDGRPVAVVTGTNRGTGQAIRAALRDVGYEVISINRTASADPVGKEYLCDFADVAALGRVLEEIQCTASAVQLLILNAATREKIPVANVEPVHWLRSLSANIAAPGIIVSALLPALRKASGVVVLVGSHAADRYFEGGALYSSTKAAAKAFVETLLLEERPNGVRSMIVSPGAISNRDDDTSEFKMDPDSVAELIVGLLHIIPEDVAVGEIEIRPARLLPGGPNGIERLQSV